MKLLSCLEHSDATHTAPAATTHSDHCHFYSGLGQGDMLHVCIGNVGNAARDQCPIYEMFGILTSHYFASGCLHQLLLVCFVTHLLLLYPQLEQTFLSSLPLSQLKLLPHPVPSFTKATTVTIHTKLPTGCIYVTANMDNQLV